MGRAEKNMAISAVLRKGLSILLCFNTDATTLSLTEIAQKVELPITTVARILKANQAVAREAIYAQLRWAELGSLKLRELRTQAPDKEAHLGNPELGAHLSAELLSKLPAENTDVQI